MRISSSFNFKSYFSTDEIRSLLSNKMLSLAIHSLIGFQCFSQMHSANFSHNTRTQIDWVKDMSWAEIKNKAKLEGKNLFIDFYATWCGPCKKMDREVYVNEKVAKYYNDNFICVKLQTDRTDNDEAYVRKMYSLTDSMVNKFHIQSYPSFVMMNHREELVHRFTGFRDADNFIAEAAIALSNIKPFNPFSSYDSLIKKAEGNDITSKGILSLLKWADSLNDGRVYGLAAGMYRSYLATVPKQSWLSIDNIQFIGRHLQRTEYFNFFVANNHKIDLATKEPKHAEFRIVDFILNTEVLPATGLETGGMSLMGITNDGKKEPDWNAIQDQITPIYGRRFSEKAILEGKVKWAENHKPYEQYAKLFCEKMIKNGVDTFDTDMDGKLNFVGYVIFNAITDREVLQEAANWMSGVVRRVGKSDYSGTKPEQRVGYYALLLDTYACLLYKLGRKSVAMELETKAWCLTPDEADKKDFYEKIQKMKVNKPTWSGRASL